MADELAIRRHLLQRASDLERAWLESGLINPVELRSCQGEQLQRACAPGDPLRTVQELLGHANAATTMIYTHVLKLGGGAVRSPADAIDLR